MELRHRAAVAEKSRPVLERRSEPRTTSTEEIAIHVPGWAGQPNPMPARVVSLSGHGMCLHTDHPVQCGVQIEIRTKRGVIVGEVCRCKHESKGYSLGVRLPRVHA
ncbi:MAG: PilZ domain-containing protein [Bryobacteraceae bacterium]